MLNVLVRSGCSSAPCWKQNSLLDDWGASAVISAWQLGMLCPSILTDHRLQVTQRAESFCSETWESNGVLFQTWERSLELSWRPPLCNGVVKSVIVLFISCETYAAINEANIPRGPRSASSSLPRKTTNISFLENIFSLFMFLVVTGQSFTIYSMMKMKMEELLS